MRRTVQDMTTRDVVAVRGSMPFKEVQPLREGNAPILESARHRSEGTRRVARRPPPR